MNEMISVVGLAIKWKHRISFIRMANIYKIVAGVSLVVIVLLISLVTILLVASRSPRIDCNSFKDVISMIISNKRLFLKVMKLIVLRNYSKLWKMVTLRR